MMTRRDYELLPEGTQVELCDGVLVKQPSPRFGHQRVQREILKQLFQLPDPLFAVPGPLDVLIDEINVFVPDIVVLDTMPKDDDPYVGVPIAVFEILSPSTRERDRNYKARRLLGLGVEEVWLVDPLSCTIDVVSVNEVRAFEGDSPARSDVMPDFSLVPAQLFMTT